MFKKHNWIPYGKKAFNIEINVKDNFNQTIDQIYLEKGKDIDNLRKLKKVEGYGFKLTKEKVEDEIEEEKEKEKSWLDKDLEW